MESEEERMGEERDSLHHGLGLQQCNYETVHGYLALSVSFIKSKVFRVTLKVEKVSASQSRIWIYRRRELMAPILLP